MNVCFTSDVLWVLLPKPLELQVYTECHFNIKVDPSELAPGVHTTTVRAYDAKNKEKGPVFTFEVTVVRPIKTNDSGSLSYDKIHFNSNFLIKREFVLVPNMVSWATLQIKHLDADVSAKFILHCVQILPHESCNLIEYRKEFSLESNEFQFHFKVEENVVLEIALAKFWQSYSNIIISYKLQFHGIVPQSKNIVMYHGMDSGSVILNPGIKNEEIQPSAYLNCRIRNISPFGRKITPLTYHGLIPPQRPIYQLNLSYVFYLPNSSKVNATCDLFGKPLYEREYESELWMLFDSNKQFITAGNGSLTTSRLNKGDYTIKIQVRHERIDVLQKIIHIQMVIPLPKQINLDVYTIHNQATIFGEKCSCFIMTPNGAKCNLYIGSLSNDEIISLNLSPGNFLIGNVIYAKDENRKKVNTYNFKYFITDVVNTKNGLKPVEKNLEKYNKAMRETKLNRLKSLEFGEDSRRFYDSLCKQFGDTNAFVHTSWIECIEPENKKIYPGLEIPGFDVKKVKLIIAAADRALNIIDQDVLLAFYGIKADLRHEASKIKISNDRLKHIVVEALCRKGAAMCQLYYYNNMMTNKRNEKYLQDIDDILIQVSRFISPNFVFKSLNYFNIWHGAVYQNYGCIMKILLMMLEDKHIKEVESCLLWTVNVKFGASSKAKHLEAAISNALVVHYPKTFRPF